jgi:hypothetical protein
MALPKAMFTLVTSSSMITLPSRLQSPTQEQVPRQTITVGGGAVGCGVNGMSVGVGCSGRLHAKPSPAGLIAQIKGSSQSVFLAHEAPFASGGAHVPAEPKMSQRSGTKHVALSQQTLSVQKPEAHASGTSGAHGLPIPSRGVGVAVGSSLPD